FRRQDFASSENIVEHPLRDTSTTLDVTSDEGGSPAPKLSEEQEELRPACIPLRAGPDSDLVPAQTWSRLRPGLSLNWFT
ncbi:hypothetical protein WMY93_032454, partial [Mugilogobius chulae]